MSLTRRGQKHERLRGLLKQTDDCLTTLAARIRAPGARKALPSAAATAAAAATAGNGPEALGLGGTAEWSSLAESLSADIAKQPAMVGGELRDYQMQAGAVASLFFTLRLVLHGLR